MKTVRWINGLLIMLILAACNPSGVSPDNLPDPEVYTTRTPNTQAAIQAYLDAWKMEDYTSMYSMLAQASRDNLSQEEFTQFYKDALKALSTDEYDYEILSMLPGPREAQVNYRIIYHSNSLGEIQRDILVNLSLEESAWHIQWDNGLILPELTGDKYLVTDCRSPARGDIFDRNGLPIATLANAVALGLEPGRIDPEQESLLLTELWRLTGIRPASIYALYEFAQPEWYIPVGEVTAEVYNQRENVLSGLSGLIMTNYSSRYYYDGGVAPQTIGYTLAIPAEELDEYMRLGYCYGQKFGAQGIEKWGEDYLSGVNAVSLYIANPDGQIATRFSQVEAQPSDSIYLTIDKDFQQQVQEALGSYNGAAVVLEVDTGRVLAMASSPSFNPNFFDASNRNNEGLINILNNPEQPLYNRAAQGEYPLGSVFKIITMAAALESGLYTSESTYDCQYDFTELTDRVLHDWTWDHCEEEKRETGEDTCTTRPSGVLTLPEGLMRSCNPWFYHIGLELYNQGRLTAIADMANGFGLGQATGIDQIAEAEGNIPYPGDGVEATSLAIGQGDTRVSPLQVAVFTAAIANGGTLYRPQIVEQIVDAFGNEIAVIQPEVRGSLPISAETLQIIQDAMFSVTNNSRGTAYKRTRGLNIPVAGKTGTAETAVPGSPHSWFAGYTLAGREDKPDIAVVVIIEYSGEGSDYAAPVFRRVVETYFYGRPQTVYWWESSIGITRTPTPETTETPTSE